MIRVLKDWEEIGRSVNYLRMNDLRFHAEPTKNWDLAQIALILKGMDRRARILDMGCGGSQVLKFCYLKGYHNLVGLDISISLADRLHQLHSLGKNLKKGRLRLPYRLLRRDLTKTGFSRSSFDLIICLSVIEHGVDPDLFFSESARLLREGGLLFLSTDYSEKKISTEGIRMYGMEWRISSKEDIASLIETARRYGLEPEGGARIPKQKDWVCEINGKRYTFISILFRKAGAGKHPSGGPV